MSPKIVGYFEAHLMIKKTATGKQLSNHFLLNQMAPYNYLSHVFLPIIPANWFSEIIQILNLETNAYSCISERMASASAIKVEHILTPEIIFVCDMVFLFSCFSLSRYILSLLPAALW